MGLTALQVQGTGLGAHFPDYKTGEYRGTTTAARFTNPDAEFRRLQTDCGVYDLGYRAKVSLTGSDRVRWLNGMVTNNVRDLGTGQGVYAFLLNPQGHILGDLYAYNRGESIVIDTDHSQLEKILATFDHYIIMDDVEVANLTDSITSLGVAGPNSRKVLAAAGIKVPETKPLQIVEAECECDGECVKCTAVQGDDPVHASYELWIAPVDVRKTWDALVAHGATPVGSEAQEHRRIVSGIPLFGVDIRDRELPQETEQARALNFSKGCYVGQEIVERIRSRGAVHRKLSGFSMESNDGIATGAKISVGDKEVGEITSIASAGAGRPTLALGYIRRELAIPGKEVRIGSTKAEVRELPFRSM